MQLTKGLGISIIIVGHITKEGNDAGSRVLEHMVDTVLYFEGDRHASYRILRSVKNRFGSTNEIGVFEMCQNGLYDAYVNIAGGVKMNESAIDLGIEAWCICRVELTTGRRT